MYLFIDFQQQQKRNCNINGCIIMFKRLLLLMLQLFSCHSLFFFLCFFFTNKVKTNPNRIINLEVAELNWSRQRMWVALICFNLAFLCLLHLVFFFASLLLMAHTNVCKGRRGMFYVFRNKTSIKSRFILCKFKENFSNFIFICKKQPFANDHHSHSFNLEMKFLKTRWSIALDFIWQPPKAISECKGLWCSSNGTARLFKPAHPILN